MADKTISGLPVGAPELLDEFAVQRTGGGVNVKMTLKSIGQALNAYGEAHSDTDHVHGPVTTTPIKLQGYDASLTAVGITVVLTPAGGSNTAAFIANLNGTYRFTFTVDVKSPATNENVDFVLNVDEVPTPFKASIDMSNASVDGGVASVNTFITVTAGQVVEIYTNSDGATFNDLLIDSLTFTAEKVGN